MKIISLISILAFIIMAFGCKKHCEPGCIDPSGIDRDKICTMEYAPVCGCNDVTYGNACLADAEGVTNWTSGPCGND